MKLKKILPLTVLVGALALGGAGCDYHKEYRYSGKIGEEQVSYNFSLPLVTNILNTLEVTRKDGTKVEYFDYKNDLKVDCIGITKDGEFILYHNDIIGKKVIEEGQKQFDGYLEEIIKLKQSKALQNISK